MKKLNFIFYLSAIFIFSFFLGCAGSPAAQRSLPLYSWGYFPNMIGEYFKNEENKAAQIQRMEYSEKNPVQSLRGYPPGFYAHLGLLYSEAGRRSEAAACFEKEKSLFPESAVYMDSIIANRFGTARPGSSGQDAPRSILVMPPVNKTVTLEITNLFMENVTMPFALAGYYVFPVTLTSETFRQNGITVPEEAANIPHSRLRQIYGADAALYITITRASSTLGTSEVAAEAVLIDLRSGEQLWKGYGSASEKSNRTVNTGRGFWADLAATALVQHIDGALNVNYYSLGSKAANNLMPAGNRNRISYGPYHASYITE